MSSAPAAADIAKDATWLVQALDARNGLARLVRMDVDSYREASFLDDRMMQQPREAHVVPWGAIRGALAIEARRDARWIFHIGHVGSTLVARLLGEVEGVLSIREPRFLRDVAMLGSADRADYTAPARALFSRTFGEDEIALVKATSFVSEIADELVPEGQRALFMYATPRNYVASILAGPNSVQELAALAPSRVQRMSGRVTLPQPRNTAEAAAAAWACEMTALESAAERMADREIAWADFDAMLADMPAELKQVAEFFGFPTDGIDAIASGPLMRRYSKATEYEYSPSLRRDLIAEAEAAHRADLDGALAMLQSAAENSPLLAKALRRAECTESSRS
jgi:hypothetical protein